MDEKFAPLRGFGLCIQDYGNSALLEFQFANGDMWGISLTKHQVKTLKNILEETTKKMFEDQG